MPEANAAALEFLKTRRSQPAKTLASPAPDRAALTKLLTIAARAPDHGKLEPWRFLVLEPQALQRLAGTLAAAGGRLRIEPERVAKLKAQLGGSPLAVVVVGSPRPSEKIPKVEQMMSAGAVCMQLLNAALSAGWGANWVTGWAVHDPEWRERNLGLMPEEWVAGVVHIGTARINAPDRPRPNLDQITEWICA